MSLKTWKKEFYSKIPTQDLTWEEACKHSLQKWEGLTDENITTHQLQVFEGSVHETFGKGVFEVNSDTCALCIKAMVNVIPDCSLCPIVKMTGEPCDASQGNTESPYSIWQNNYEPQPMQKLLKETLEYIQTNPDKFS